MDYEFKRLSDVETVAEASDVANVLIEEDGVIKRVPKKEVGGGVEVTNAAAVGQTLVVKAVDEEGMPVEWETVDMDGLVKKVMAEVGVEKVTVQKKVISNTIYGEEGEWNQKSNGYADLTSNSVTILPGDVLTCTRSDDGEFIDASSYIFPAIDEETGVFVGAEFYDSYTETYQYYLYADFPEMLNNEQPLVIKMLLTYNSNKVLTSIHFYVDESVGDPQGYYVELAFSMTKDLEYLVLNDPKVRDVNGNLLSIRTVSNDY